jgi:hypothetical protein
MLGTLIMSYFFFQFGYIMEVEGVRLRAGGRTYFLGLMTLGVQGYAAYGFKDNRI